MINRFEEFEEETVNAYTGTLKESCYQEIDADENIVDEDLKC